MRRMVEAFNTGDLTDVNQIVSARYVDHQGIGGSEMFGPEGFSEVVRLFRHAHPWLRVEIEKLAANSDTVQFQLFWSEPRADKEYSF